MAKTRKKRTAYTAQQKTTILATAQREGLTALQVQKKFGVTPVTYYSWRKKSGASRRGRGRGLAIAALAGSAGLHGQVRAEVQNRVRQILPEIVRSEVNDYLSTLFGGVRRGRARRT